MSNQPNRVTFRCSDSLLGAIDEARGDVPRERWLRRVVSERLMVSPADQITESSTVGAIAVGVPTVGDEEKPRPLTRSEAFRQVTQRHAAARARNREATT
jgi:hypothetical protein